MRSPPTLPPPSPQKEIGACTNTVNEKHVVSVVLEFKITRCNIQQNLVNTSIPPG